MGQISYDQIQAQKQNSEQTTTQGPRVGFFSLKNDGDETLVRFMIDDPADLDIMVVHPTVINGKHKKVNCIRDAKDDLEKCPFCAAQKPVQQRLYIHLIEYTKNEQGQVVATPKMWERSTSYITTLKNLCAEYAPLSDNLFKIKRNGEAGSFDTTYDILFANPNVYRSDIYIKDEKAFEGITSLGTAVINYDYEKLNNLLNNENPAPAAQPAPAAPTQSYNQDNSQEMARPRRYY